jgi:hypothetical protein
MYSPQEETQILRGIGEIMDNLRYVPSEDFAYFLVKYDPMLAERLAAQIQFTFQDLELQEKEKNAR